jgi:transmembrane sensor
MNPAATSEDVSRDEQAGHWCARIARSRLSFEEEARFNAWLAEDPANGQAFDQAVEVWQALHDVADTPEVIGMRAEVLTKLRQANARRWSRRVARSLKWPMALAASLALVVVSSVWMVSGSAQSYQTAIGERRTFLLEDGSRLSLDADTKIQASFERDHRELTLLAGRAKFDVAKDRSRPFTVTAGEQTIVATGTSFSVERLGDKVHVVVYEGQVAIVPRKDPSVKELKQVVARVVPVEALLNPGRELVAPDDRAGGSIGSVDVGRAGSWEGGQLNFVDEPLGDAVERLNRYQDEKLVVADADLSRIRINGVFNAGDNSAFVEALEAAYPVQARREPGKILLTNRSL